MLYEREPEEIIDPLRPTVENRLLKFGKKYEEKKMKLKETIYREMMQDRPFVQSNYIPKKASQSVVSRLYEAPHCGNNCGSVEKLVKQSSVRYPLNELVRPMSSQNPYSNLPSQQSPTKHSQILSNSQIQGKFLENTFSHSQKIKPVRYSSYANINHTNNSIHKQSTNTNSIIQLSMDLFSRKKKSQC